MMDKAYFLKTLANFRTLIRDKEEYPDVVLNQYYGALKGYCSDIWMEAQAKVLLDQEYRSMPLIGTFIKACESVRSDKVYRLQHPEKQDVPLLEDKDGQPPPPEEYARLMAEQMAIINRLCGKFAL